MTLVTGSPIHADVADFCASKAVANIYDLAISKSELAFNSDAHHIEYVFADSHGHLRLRHTSSVIHKFPHSSEHKCSHGAQKRGGAPETEVSKHLRKVIIKMIYCSTLCNRRVYWHPLPHKYLRGPATPRVDEFFIPSSFHLPSNFCRF